MVRPFSHRVTNINDHSSHPDKQYIDLLNVLRMSKRFQDTDALVTGLFSEAEVTNLTKRWQIVKWLWTTDLTYREIAQSFNTSTRAVLQLATKIQVKQEAQRPFMFLLMMRFGATHRQAWKEMRA
jgi:Trp operon repressor